MKKLIPAIILALMTLLSSAQSPNDYDCTCQYLNNGGRMGIATPQVYRTGIQTGYGSNVDQKSKWSVIQAYLKTIDSHITVAEQINANVEQLLTLIQQADAQGYNITGLRAYFAILTETGNPKLDELTKNERNQLSVIWVPTKVAPPPIPPSTDPDPDPNYKDITNEDVCFYIVPNSATSSVVMLKGSEAQQWVTKYKKELYVLTNANIGKTDVTPPANQTEAKSLWYSMPQLLKLEKLIICQISKNGKLTKKSKFNIVFAGHDQKLDDFVNYDNKLKRIDASKQLTLLLNIDDMPTSECTIQKINQRIGKILESLDKEKDKKQYTDLIAIKEKIKDLENFSKDKTAEKEAAMKEIWEEFSACYFTIMKGGPGGPLSDFDTALPCPPAVCVELEP